MESCEISATLVGMRREIHSGHNSIATRVCINSFADIRKDKSLSCVHYIFSNLHATNGPRGMDGEYYLDVAAFLYPHFIS